MTPSQRTKEYREWAKSKGICINCCKERAWNGRQMCAECLDKAKARSERTRSNQSKHQRYKYIKRKRELCIAFGICRECLNKPATCGKKCIECKAKEIKRNNRKRKEVPRNMRVELGLCYFCGDKAIKGKGSCEKHHKIVSNNLKKWERNNSKHIWRTIQGMEINIIRSFKTNG